MYLATILRHFGFYLQEFPFLECKHSFMVEKKVEVTTLSKSYTLLYLLRKKSSRLCNYSTKVNQFYKCTEAYCQIFKPSSQASKINVFEHLQHIFQQLSLKWLAKMRKFYIQFVQCIAILTFFLNGRGLNLSLRNVELLRYLPVGGLCKWLQQTFVPTITHVTVLLVTL